MNYSASLVEQFTFVILLSTFATVLPYLICSIAHLFMSTKTIKALYSTPLNTITTLIAMIFSCWIIKNIGSETTVLGCVLLLAGLPIYFLMKKEQKKQLAFQQVIKKSNHLKKS